MSTVGPLPCPSKVSRTSVECVYSRAYALRPTTGGADCHEVRRGRVVGLSDTASASHGADVRQWAPTPVRDLTSSSAYLPASGSSLDRSDPIQPSRKPSGIEIRPGFSSGNQWKSTPLNSDVF